eukprot:9194475-Ditylum_brightwellii.AAC.1
MSEQSPRKSPRRSVSRNQRNSRIDDENEEEQQQHQQQQQQGGEQESTRNIIQRRNRAVAEREASRLARPDQPVQDTALGHASKGKSAVTSTPFGFFGKQKNDSSSAVQEEWCGPFSVARQ